PAQTAGDGWPAPRNQDVQGVEAGVGKLGIWAIAIAACVGCGQSRVREPIDDGNPSTGPDGGKPPPILPPPGPPHAAPPPPPPPPPDGGQPDAGNPPPSDGGTFTFGTPGPWPVANVTWGAADGIQESPVVGLTTDETENIWVATHSALYVMRPGGTHFTRYGANSRSTAVEPHGVHHPLHPPGN